MLYHHGAFAVEDVEPQFFHNVAYGKLGLHGVACLVNWRRECGYTKDAGKYTDDTAAHA